MERHKETLWACDFFSVKTVTTRGMRDLYVLVWLCVNSREVIVSASTDHPNSAWVTKQAERFVSETSGREHSPALVMHDRDTKFTKEFTEALLRRGVEQTRYPKPAPI